MLGSHPNSSTYEPAGRMIIPLFTCSCHGEGSVIEAESA